MYEEDLTNQCAIHLTEIHPKHIGTVFIRSSPGNLTINARKLLGGELKIHIEHSSTWKSFHVRIDGQRTFFFFPQNFSTEFSIDLDRSSYDFTLIRNENDRLQWNWMKNTSHFYHLFLLNTTWLEFNYQTQVIRRNQVDLKKKIDFSRVIITIIEIWQSNQVHQSMDGLFGISME